MGSGSVDRLSPNGAALIASHVARIRATSPDTWRPGVAEQYALQVDKLNAGTASTSIVSMPIYTSRPSASLYIPLSRFSPACAKTEDEQTHLNRERNTFRSWRCLTIPGHAVPSCVLNASFCSMNPLTITSHLFFPYHNSTRCPRILSRHPRWTRTTMKTTSVSTPSTYLNTEEETCS